MHLFPRHSVYKHLCTVKVRQGFAERKVCVVDVIGPSVGFNNQHFSTVSTDVRGLEGRGWVLNSLISHPLHYRIALPLDQSLSSSVCFPSLAVRSSSLMLRRSCCDVRNSGRGGGLPRQEPQSSVSLCSPTRVLGTSCTGSDRISPKPLLDQIFLFKYLPYL